MRSSHLIIDHYNQLRPESDDQLIPGPGQRARPADEPERHLHLVHRQLRLLQEQPPQLEGAQSLRNLIFYRMLCSTTSL